MLLEVVYDIAMIFLRVSAGVLCLVVSYDLVSDFKMWKR